jgi:hypothetical protein
MLSHLQAGIVAAKADATLNELWDGVAWAWPL